MHMHMHMYMCMQNRTGSIDGATRAAYYNAALERATDYKGKAVYSSTVQACSGFDAFA